MNDEPNKVTTVLKVVVTGEFYDDDATEETLRYAVEQDLEDAGFDVDVSMLKEQEAIKPTINEYGEAYCVCGENVGIIPNSKNLPKILSKYCSECGRRMKWE